LIIFRPIVGADYGDWRKGFIRKTRLRLFSVIAVPLLLASFGSIDMVQPTALVSSILGFISLIIYIMVVILLLKKFINEDLDEEDTADSNNRYSEYFSGKANSVFGRSYEVFLLTFKILAVFIIQNSFMSAKAQISSLLLLDNIALALAWYLQPFSDSGLKTQTYVKYASFISAEVLLLIVQGEESIAQSSTWNDGVEWVLFVGMVMMFIGNMNRILHIAGQAMSQDNLLKSSFDSKTKEDEDKAKIERVKYRVAEEEENGGDSSI